MGPGKYFTTGLVWDTKWRTLVSHLGPKGFFSFHILPLDTSWRKTRAISALQENWKKKTPKQATVPVCICHWELHHTEVDRHGCQETPGDDHCCWWKKIPLCVVLRAQCRSMASQPNTQLEGDKWTLGSAGGNWTWIYRASGKGFGCSAWAGARVSSIWKSAVPVSFTRGHVHRALLAL